MMVADEDGAVDASDELMSVVAARLRVELAESAARLRAQATLFPDGERNTDGDATNELEGASEG
ncbi:MAG TPA: hypothetical protein VH372_05010 [Actinospica sp.]|nr:hypothetical protein [Actinospica sp.]